jgi:hypothetical protein
MRIYVENYKRILSVIEKNMKLEQDTQIKPSLLEVTNLS